jgi:hypothetical protein
MKGKLNKVDNGYVLLVDNIMYATDNDKLSQSNCDEIFGIVDVNKLAEEWVFDKNGHKWSNNDNSAGDNYGSYKEGFNKAMELNKDKMFTLADIEKAFDSGYEMLDSPKKYNDVLVEINKKLLQPTEIEVEILCLHTGDPEYTTNTGLPKLDEDGCLILKKI